MTAFELKEKAIQRIVELRENKDIQENEDLLRQAVNDFLLACLAIVNKWDEADKKTEE